MVPVAGECKIPVELAWNGRDKRRNGRWKEGRTRRGGNRGGSAGKNDGYNRRKKGKKGGYRRKKGKKGGWGGRKAMKGRKEGGL